MMKLSLVKVLSETKARQDFELIQKKFAGKLIHFSDVEGKLGIRPMGNQDDTPIGIYGYIIGKPYKGLFATKRKFYYIFEPKNPETTIVIQQGGGSSIDNQTEELIKKIYDQYRLNPALLEKQFQKYSYRKTPFSKFWLASKLASSDFYEDGGLIKNSNKWNKILRNLGFSAIIDNGSGIIYSGEPYQGVCLSGTDLNVLHAGINPEKGTFKIDAANIDNEEALVRQITGGRMKI